MNSRLNVIYSNSDHAIDAKSGGNIIPLINYRVSAPTRCLDMLLAKHRGEPYQSEVCMPENQKYEVPNLQKSLSESTILLITDGGLVPRDNPDRMPSTSSTAFYVYPLDDCEKLKSEDYEVSHQGYDITYVEEDPNRLLPVDALRELEREGIIGGLKNHFLSTTGVMTSIEQSRELGKKIASYAASDKADAVIIVSVCGTSTRCGAYIGLAIEEQNIPVVQITNLTRIATDVGLARVLRGNSVCHPIGNPFLSEKNEYEYRKKVIMEALNLLTKQLES